MKADIPPGSQDRVRHSWQKKEAPLEPVKFFANDGTNVRLEDHTSAIATMSATIAMKAANSMSVMSHM